MAEPESLRPIVPYELLNTDSDILPKSGKESRRKYRACNKAFKKFVQLRGEILSQAIAVENELDCIISCYFVPYMRTTNHDAHGEDNRRRNAFVDLILGQENFMISSKITAVASIIELSEVTKSSPKAFRRLLEPVVEIRNQFAHRRVALDWQSQEVALWDAKKRSWGFPDFDVEGKKAKRGRDRIPEDLADLYTKFCRKAITVSGKVCTEITVQSLLNPNYRRYDA